MLRDIVAARGADAGDPASLASRDRGRDKQGTSFVGITCRFTGKEPIMSDSKSQVGKADRDRVAASQPYEVNYLVKKYGLSKEIVERIVQQYGPMRKDVETQL